MEWINKVNQAISYVEKNLYDEIEYKEIDKIILSPTDVLQRFFMLNTGITLTEYIRRWKLNEAVKLLRNSNEKIINIAVKLGYGSSDSFSLAFKKLYGISPSEARISNVALKPFPRIVFSLSITYVEGEITVKNINEIKPFVEEQEIFLMPEVRIIGIEGRCKLHTGSNSDVMEVWQRFDETVTAKLDNLPRAMPNALLGWTGDCPEGSDTYSYVISVICPAGTPVPEGLVYRDLPASYVAKGRYGDGLNDVINTFTSKGFLTCYIDLPWNADLTGKKITKAVYDMRKAELVKSTEDLNKCIKALNAQHAKM